MERAIAAGMLEAEVLGRDGLDHAARRGEDPVEALGERDR